MMVAMVVVIVKVVEEKGGVGKLAAQETAVENRHCRILPCRRRKTEATVRSNANKDWQCHQDYRHYHHHLHLMRIYSCHVKTNKFHHLLQRHHRRRLLQAVVDDRSLRRYRHYYRHQYTEGRKEILDLLKTTIMKTTLMRMPMVGTIYNYHLGLMI
jgi:hypothetical protein